MQKIDLEWDITGIKLKERTAIKLIKNKERNER